MKISELTAGHNLQNFHALVAEKKTSLTRAGKQFANVVLQDDTGSVKCVKWEYKPEKYDHLLEAGTIVKVGGSVSTYNGEIQVTLITIEPPDEGYAITDFAVATKLNAEQMKNDLLKVIDDFTEPLTTYVTKSLIDKYLDKFCEVPAALKLHHAWYGGLLEHVHSMIGIALHLIKHYQTRFTTKLSSDKVLFGVIIHDLGKIFEYDSSTPVFGMQPSGQLVNHIIKAPILISQAAEKWYDALHELQKTSDVWQTFEWERDQLIHIIASHHGTLEFGSPVRPASLEALLVHHIDILDSDFTHAVGMVEGKEGNVAGFSEYSRTRQTSYLK
jgi:3'-5' exoribonuclease